MKSNRFLLLVLPLIAAFVLTGSAPAQSSTQISRRCPGSSPSPARATIEVQKDGDINIKPCAGRALQQNDVAITIAQPFELVAAITDETTDLAAVNGAITFHIPRPFTAVEVWAGLTTVSSSGVVTVDINKAGVSIFTTNFLTIDALEETSLTAATAANLTTLSFVKGDKITVDIDAAGTGAKGLKLYFLGVR